MVIVTIIVAVILLLTLFSFALVMDEETLKILKDDTIILKIAKLYVIIILSLGAMVCAFTIAYMIVRTVADLSCELNNNDMKICQEVINK